MKVSTVEEMRRLDRGAVERYAIADAILMENAGQAVHHVIRSEIGVAGGRFAVLCGPGNNGGDGLVVARTLLAAGGIVTTLVLADPERYQGSARRNYEMLVASGAGIVERPPREALERALADCEVVVDGLLGTGITREVDGAYREAIEAVNRCGAMVVAVDIPSGVDGDTGAVRGVAVEADLTVTFGLPKRGNLFQPGAELGGRLFLSHISFPPSHAAAPEIGLEISVPGPLPPRPVDGHKGSFGDVLFVAGARSYYGAPSFAARSLLRAGGGYARLATPASLAPVVAALAPEVVLAPQPETGGGSLSLAAEGPILALAEQVDMVVVGPGLSLDEETQELVRRLTRAVARPLLVDGDGLTAIAADPRILAEREAPTVLTPHPGEMARLRGTSVAEITAERVGAVQELAASSDAIVVLKGARSLVGAPDGRVWINPSGNSGMASAGSGDVLTGAIAAMRGLGLELEEAVRTGVFLHGLAGDLAAAELGEDGLTAADLLDHLPDALAAFRESHEEVAADCYGTVEVV